LCRFINNQLAQHPVAVGIVAVFEIVGLRAQKAVKTVKAITVVINLFIFLGFYLELLKDHDFIFVFYQRNMLTSRFEIYLF